MFSWVPAVFWWTGGQLYTVLWWTLALMLLSTVCVAAVAFFFNRKVTYCRNFTRMDGQTAVITGGTSGVGKEVARQLLSRGCHVVLAADDVAEGRKVAEELERSVVGVAKVDVLHLDISSLESVRSFAHHVIISEKRLDVLVLHHSQGAPPSRREVEGGLEVTMAANYFGQFLLTNLLFSLLKVTPNSRVVVAVSPVHSLLRTISVQDLNFTKERYTPLRAVALSHVCLLLFTRHMALLGARHGVVVNCYSPGFVRISEREKGSDVITGFCRYWAGLLIGRSALQGSQTCIYLATSTESLTGTAGYFIDCKCRETPPLAANQGLAQKLFEKTEEIVRLKDTERRYV